MICEPTKNALTDATNDMSKIPGQAYSKKEEKINEKTCNLWRYLPCACNNWEHKSLETLIKVYNKSISCIRLPPAAKQKLAVFTVGKLQLK